MYLQLEDASPNSLRMAALRLEVICWFLVERKMDESGKDWQICLAAANPTP